jgi:hypothetical protein
MKFLPLEPLIAERLVNRAEEKRRNSPAQMWQRHLAEHDEHAKREMTH